MLKFNKTINKLRVATLYATSSIMEPHVNVSNRQFYNSEDFIKIATEKIYDLNLYMIFSFDDSYVADWYGQVGNVNENIVKKIQFVKRLFSEMRGIKDNATQVAIIFIDGSRLSFQDTRNIPNVIELQRTDIRILVVVFYVINVQNVVYLRNTLLVEYESNDLLR
jgi:hypothetical protein